MNGYDFYEKIIRQDLQDIQDFFCPFSRRKWANPIAFGEEDSAIRYNLFIQMLIGCGLHPAQV